MWIICAGAKRSGSTLQYNILSRLVEIAGVGKRIAHFKPDEFTKVKEEYTGDSTKKVIKAHGLTEDLKEVISNGDGVVFHCYRDIRDVVVSYINKGWMQKDEASIKDCVTHYLSEYEAWTHVSDQIHSRKYENFVYNIKAEASYYARVLGLEISEENLQQIAEELDLDKLKEGQNAIEDSKKQERFNNTFHKDTLLHTNHIKDGSSNQFLKELSGAEIALIEAKAYHFLVENGYELHWTRTGEFLSFAQHADDYIAWQLLGKKSKGLVVEVGAFDGLHLSNSCALNQLGWQSICVEPSPAIYKYLQQKRPNSHNVNKAIVGEEGVDAIDFYSEEIGVLSGCDYDAEDLRKRYENRGLTYKEPEKIKVEAATLNRILSEYDPSLRKIDLISIDVEGFEMEVLKGLDLNTYRVGLFIIEANGHMERARLLKYFSDYPDYVHIGNNLQNLFIMNRSVGRKKWMKQLDFEGYFKAKQQHPAEPSLSLDSVPPKFEKSKGYQKVQKSFKLF